MVQYLWTRFDASFAALVAGLRIPKFKIIGTDVAGTVEAVGRNVAQFRPGDGVFRLHSGNMGNS